MSHEIATRAEAGVSTISFNRLERKNSITGPMYAALAEALSAAATDPSSGLSWAYFSWHRWPLAPWLDASGIARQLRPDLQPLEGRKHPKRPATKSINAIALAREA